ncbi:hypothetical protein D781_1096 [Serratia sp. FGI94]|uniref:hypothetical protein n=1 Tax=Serratia sp. FGI94 TaxID=671990 RepID=UPI0002A723B2|nr:hypothetical protein [Serratia sp. FGI94]AGB81423.1 hypothetical protein D781_1096 [Serratia sp. FGI94]
MPAFGGTAFDTFPIGLGDPTETVLLAPREEREKTATAGDDYSCIYQGENFSLGATLDGKTCRLMEIKSGKLLSKVSVLQWVKDGEMF